MWAHIGNRPGCQYEFDQFSIVPRIFRHPHPTGRALYIINSTCHFRLKYYTSIVIKYIDWPSITWWDEVSFILTSCSNASYWSIMSIYHKLGYNLKVQMATQLQTKSYCIRWLMAVSKLTSESDTHSQRQSWPSAEPVKIVLRSWETATAVIVCDGLLLPHNTTGTTRCPPIFNPMILRYSSRSKQEPTSQCNWAVVYQLSIKKGEQSISLTTTEAILASNETRIWKKNGRYTSERMGMLITC